MGPGSKKGRWVGEERTSRISLVWLQKKEKIIKKRYAWFCHSKFTKIGMNIIIKRDYLPTS